MCPTLAHHLAGDCRELAEAGDDGQQDGGGGDDGQVMMVMMVMMMMIMMMMMMMGRMEAGAGIDLSLPITSTYLRRMRGISCEPKVSPTLKYSCLISSSKKCPFPIYANFRTYVLKSLT